jgi:hypothetical protein
VLFKIFFAKEYPTNKTLNTANKILMKNEKSIFLEKFLCYEKLPKFEQYFELVSRIVKLNLLTRKTTVKIQHGSSANFSNNLFKQNNSVAMVTTALPIIENISI